MLCEMCGRETRVLKSVEIDGAVLRVCERCARFGKEVQAPRRQVAVPKRRRVRREERDIFDEMTEDLVEDYPRRVREARQRMGLSQEDLGKKIGERRSVIQKIEAGDKIPEDRVVRKLERFLKITLRRPRGE